MAPSNSLIPSVAQRCDDIKAKFGIYPCIYQVQDAQAQLKKENCITIAATGAGKTSTFWIALLYNNGGCIIVVTALNILRDQGVSQLKALNIKAINMTLQNESPNLFKVCLLKFDTFISSS